MGTRIRRRLWSPVSLRPPCVWLGIVGPEWCGVGTRMEKSGAGTRIALIASRRACLGWRIEAPCFPCSSRLMVTLSFSFSFLISKLTITNFILFGPGDLWSASEGGGIKIWAWESIQKSLSLTSQERPMAALLLERSYIDLNNNILTSDVKYLLSDHSRAKVWTATYLSFALWYLSTFNILSLPCWIKNLFFYLLTLALVAPFIPNIRMQILQGNLGSQLT